MFITRAIERGVDVKVIAEWQGHKDGGKLILDTYSHVNRAHSHRMAQLMTDGLPAENVIPSSGQSMKCRNAREKEMGSHRSWRLCSKFTVRPLRALSLSPFVPSCES